MGFAVGFKQAEGLSSCGRCVPVAVLTAPRTPTLFVHRADLSGFSKKLKVMVVDFSLVMSTSTTESAQGEQKKMLILQLINC